MPSSIILHHQGLSYTDTTIIWKKSICLWGTQLRLTIAKSGRSFLSPEASKAPVPLPEAAGIVCLQSKGCPSLGVLGRTKVPQLGCLLPPHTSVAMLLPCDSSSKSSMWMTLLGGVFLCTETMTGTLSHVAHRHLAFSIQSPSDTFKSRRHLPFLFVAAGLFCVASQAAVGGVQMEFYDYWPSPAGNGALSPVQENLPSARPHTLQMWTERS